MIIIYNDYYYYTLYCNFNCISFGKRPERVKALSISSVTTCPSLGLYLILSRGYDTSGSFAYYICLNSLEFKTNSNVIHKEL